MAQLKQAFDSGRHEDMNDFEPIPNGVYPAQVTASKIKETKDKKGEFIEFEFTVMSGDFKGRKIWTRLNIVNLSPVTVEIAQKELATLCRACGKSVIQDTQQIHGIPFLLKVRTKPAKGDYPASNVPSGYESLKKKEPNQGASDENPFGDEDNADGESDAGAAMNGDPDAGVAQDDGFADDAPWGEEPETAPDDDVPF